MRKLTDWDLEKAASRGYQIPGRKEGIQNSELFKFKFDIQVALFEVLQKKVSPKEISQKSSLKFHPIISN
jgi:hypothetical protein